MASLAALTAGQSQRDLVQGNLIQFNDNGTWCWYQDERAVIDAIGGKLILGSDASRYGVGGQPRDGDVEAVVFDFRTGLLQKTTLREGDPSVFYADDHNAPAFIVRPDGNYPGFSAAHFGDTSSHYRLYTAGTWGPEQVFNWSDGRPRLGHTVLPGTLSRCLRACTSAGSQQAAFPGSTRCSC